ncbi:MAG: hypothetical protein PVI40_06830 [Chlamydiota bacterium]|jgi:hypothetical protein
MRNLIAILIVFLFSIKGFSSVSENLGPDENFAKDQHQMLSPKMNKNIFSQNDGKVYAKFGHYSGGSKAVSLGHRSKLAPYISMGYRTQNNYIGHDFSVSEVFVYDKYTAYNDLSLEYSFLCYPFPNVAKEIYFGPTTGLSIFSVRWDGFAMIPMVNLGGVLGAQYKVKDKLHFIQAKVGAQTLPKVWFTGASISYGVSF